MASGRRHELPDAAWAVLEPMPPRVSRGRPWHDRRRVVNGILCVIATGVPRRNAPVMTETGRPPSGTARCRLDRRPRGVPPAARATYSNHIVKKGPLSTGDPFLLPVFVQLQRS